MADNGEEKLIAVARHIAKTLGQNDTTAEDILQIFSNFDGRLREKLSEKISDDDDRRGFAGLEQSLKSLDRQISRYVVADHPIWSDSSDAASFLDSVDELVGLVRDWTPMAAAEKPVASCLDRAEDLLQQAMFRLEEEFKMLMERGGEAFDVNRYKNGEDSAAPANYLFESSDDDEDDEGEIPIAHPVSDFNIIIDALPSGTINDLHEIAKRMVAAGYGKECSHAYSSCRRDFLEESFSRLGLQKLSIDEVQKMQWADLEDEIGRWINAMNVALKILFPSERRLCDRVFFGFSSPADLSFMEVCRGSTIQLLNFADAIAIGSRAPERLFKVLDVYETLRDLMHDFEMVLSDEYCVFLTSEANTIWKRLGESIRGIFMELENLIRRDPAKASVPANASVPGGGLHPITRYVMNYLRAACRSRQTLEQVFEESIAPPSDRSMSSSSMSVQMDWIMELLESNLEAKSKIYRDSALCSVFMMNNGRYIVQKVKDSELGSLLGEDWIRKHTAKVRQYHVNYQRSSWSKVLGALKLDQNSLSPTVASKSLKEKLKSFNLYFDEICRTQSTWVIFDEQMRNDMRTSIISNLSPAYRNFLVRLQNMPENIGKQTEKHIKYSVDQLEDRIKDLFRGSSNGRK